MNLRKHKTDAFTMIELLGVIAVIAILSGILIPTVGGVIKQSRIAASKAQLWQYITAIENFKAEYNYYPQVYGNDGNGDGLIDFEDDSANFIGALSGSDGGNYREIQFHSFSENEFQNKDSSTDQLSDSFNNIEIFILIDVDGDGMINPDSDDPESPDQIRGNATAWVEGDVGKGYPGYALWE